jgi:polysaccharide deacetylase 2 family uncharacterized protein YibQ
VWSLNPIRRTALFFYLLLAVLLGTVVAWPAPNVTMAVATPQSDAVLTNPQSLIYLHNSFRNSWRQYLFDRGFGLVLDTEIQKTFLREEYKRSFEFNNLIPAYLHTAPEAAGKTEKNQVVGQAGKTKEAEIAAVAGKAEETGKLEGAPKSQTESSAAAAGKTEMTAPPPPKYQARVGIIIDDVGASMETMDEFLKIDAPLAWSILPFTTFARECALLGKEHGYEIMLHLPLEPINDQEDPGPGLIRRSYCENQIINQFILDLLGVPGAIGVNNHMGSAGTADYRLMLVLMSELKKRNLFFIDSLTTYRSVGDKCAALYRVPMAKRNVFIDNEADMASKLSALGELLQQALKYGTAIGIGHARKGTGEAIFAMLPQFAAAGVEIVPVSQLVTNEHNLTKK